MGGVFAGFHRSRSGESSALVAQRLGGCQEERQITNLPRLVTVPPKASTSYLTKPDSTRSVLDLSCISLAG